MGSGPEGADRVVEEEGISMAGLFPMSMPNPGVVEPPCMELRAESGAAGEVAKPMSRFHPIQKAERPILKKPMNIPKAVHQNLDREGGVCHPGSL